MAGRVIVGCSSGEDNPDAVTVAYLTAGAALDQGKEVVLWLTSHGVRLALRGYTDQIRTDKDPPGQRLHAQFVEKGGRFYVCPVCFKERDLSEDELVAGARIRGSASFAEEILRDDVQALVY